MSSVVTIGVWYLKVVNMLYKMQITVINLSSSVYSLKKRTGMFSSHTELRSSLSYNFIFCTN